MQALRQLEGTAAYRRIPVRLVDYGDGWTPETGVTSPTVEVLKTGGSWDAGGGSFVETGHGCYYYEALQGELDTLGVLLVRVVKGTQTREFVAGCQVVVIDPYAAAVPAKLANISHGGGDASLVLGSLQVDLVASETVGQIQAGLASQSSVNDVQSGVSTVTSIASDTYGSVGNVLTAISGLNNLGTDEVATATANALADNGMGSGWAGDVLNGVESASGSAMTAATNTSTLLDRLPGVVQPQTGDAYARLGSPSGLTVSEDIASVATLAGGAASAATSASLSASTAATRTQTILDRIGAFTGSGVNTILGFLRALLSKAASTPSDVGGTYDPATDSAEAIRDRGDAAWITGEDEGGGDVQIEFTDTEVK